MTTDVFLIRTPTRRSAGMTYGGPLRLKIGSRIAYAGFRSVALAEEVCEHWQIRGERFIEPLAEAARHDRDGRSPTHVVVFEDSDDFRGYLLDPASFSYETHMLPIHPGLFSDRDGPSD